MNHVFSLVPKVEIPRSRFNRNHTYKCTLDAGKLVPFFWDDVIPGDSFNVNVSMFCRMATLISPIMDDLWIDTHYFFVPYRLVWNNFQKFMGEQENPGDSIDYVIPQLFQSSNNSAKRDVQVESLCDYMGLPLLSAKYGGVNGINVSALPFRAVALIWNEWFRDENLQDSIPINKTDSYGVFNSSVSDIVPGVNNFLYINNSGSCFPRSKRHDYFTSSLPWPLKDGTGVEVPLGGQAPIVGTSLNVPTFSGIGSTGSIFGASVTAPTAGFTGKAASFEHDPVNFPDAKWEAGSALSSAGDPYADLNNVYAMTVNTLRTSFQVQRFLERSARSGSRYTEILRGMFGTISPDARLQRPEYLGGSSHKLQVNVVPQTSASNDDTPQANLAAFVTGVKNRDGFTKSFVEHGVVIGFVSIRGPLLYQQGINRILSKKTRYDFYWPSFAHLGEQAVLNKEIYAQGTSADEGVWGYQERYAEYRYKPSMICGKFRSTYAQSLDSWHLGQKFDSLPTLSNQFIQENPPISRVIAVPSEPQFLLDCHIGMDCARPMPLYGVPGLIDHF